MTGLLAVLGLPVLIVVLILFSVIGAVYQGWALEIVWRWLAEPYLHLPHVTALQFMVALLIYGMFTAKWSRSKTTSELTKDWWSVLSFIVITPLLWIAMAWLAKEYLIPWWYS